MKDLGKVIEGPIVAVQYPSVAPFSVDESTATELSVKYSHLKDLDVDDKKAYKELVAAIKDVSSNRIQINKEEETAKKPLNEFRNLILKTGKVLRAAFEPIEGALKAEKDRIDTVLADREAAKRKVWQDNLNDFRLKYNSIDYAKTIDDLYSISESIGNAVIDYEIYGDFEEDAKALQLDLMDKCGNAIKCKKEQEEFEAKRIAFEKEQEEAAERERVANEERDAMAKRIAELEKAAEPEPEIQPLKEVDHSEIAKNKDVVIDRPEAPAEPIQVGGRGSCKSSSVFNEISSKSGSDVRIDVDVSVVGDISVYATVSESGPIEVVHDGAALGMFIAALGRANNMRVITHTKEQNEAVDRVKATLTKAIGYLNGFDGE